jgi:hypothetical protein
MSVRVVRVGNVGVTELDVKSSTLRIARCVDGQGCGTVTKVEIVGPIFPQRSGTGLDVPNPHDSRFRDNGRDDRVVAISALGFVRAAVNLPADIACEKVIETRKAQNEGNQKLTDSHFHSHFSKVLVLGFRYSQLVVSASTAELREVHSTIPSDFWGIFKM